MDRNEIAKRKYLRSLQKPAAPPTPEKLEEAKNLPHVSLPGNPHEDAIVGALSDGKQVPAGCVELIYNEARRVDFAYGAGAYERSTKATIENPTQLEVLSLARRLYAAR